MGSERCGGGRVSCAPASLFYVVQGIPTLFKLEYCWGRCRSCKLSLTAHLPVAVSESMRVIPTMMSFVDSAPRFSMDRHFFNKQMEPNNNYVSYMQQIVIIYPRGVQGMNAMSFHPSTCAHLGTDSVCLVIN